MLNCLAYKLENLKYVLKYPVHKYFKFSFELFTAIINPSKSYTRVQFRFHVHADIFIAFVYIINSK